MIAGPAAADHGDLMPMLRKEPRMRRQHRLHPADNWRVAVMDERDFQATRCGPFDAPPASMKYLVIVAAVALVCFILARNTPEESITAAVTASEAGPLSTGPREPAAPAPTNSLKAPLDRTHSALEKVKSRNGGGEF